MVYKQDEQLTTRTNGSESRLNGSLYKLAKQVTKLVYDTFMLQLTTKKAHARHNHTQWSQQTCATFQTQPHTVVSTTCATWVNKDVT